MVYPCTLIWEKQIFPCSAEIQRTVYLETKVKLSFVYIIIATNFWKQSFMEITAQCAELSEWGAEVPSL